VVERGQQSSSHPDHFTSGDISWELLVRGGCAGLGASLEILEKRKMSCPSQESNYSPVAA